MIDYVEIGSTPAEEDCEQLGPNYDPEQARLECRTFIGQLRRQFGEEPAGARLVVKSNPHDFGTYLEVAVKFSDENEEAAEYAFKLESESPAQWDDAALIELSKGPKGQKYLERLV
jgi:hypothetical protein